MDNKAMFYLSYGLFVITTREYEKDNGCISNTVIQVTTNPNQISVTLNKETYTHGMIERTGVFNVSILSQDAKFDTFKHWGFQSGAMMNKAIGVLFSRATNGLIYITEGVNAVLCGKVVNSIDLVTHTMFIADVTDAFCVNTIPSATYAYYHSNIKPHPESPKKKGWVCSVCGHIYEGEELPADFVCPVCKHPASVYKEISVWMAM